MRLLLAALLLAPALAGAQVPRAANQYRIAVTASAAAQFGPTAPVAMLAAQLHVESGWRSDAVSPARAEGIAQFIPSTAAAMARIYPDLRPPLPYDPAWGIRARDRLLAENLRRYAAGRSVCTGWLLSLLAYNGSPAALDREIAACRADENCDPARYFNHIELQRSRVQWAWNENRKYPISILVRQPLYSSWGPQICRADP